MLSAILNAQVILTETFSNYTPDLLPNTQGLWYINTSANDILTDRSGNNRSLTARGASPGDSILLGSPLFSGGYGYYLDGVDEYLEHTTASNFNPGTGDFSIFLVYRIPTNFKDNQQIIGKRGAETDYYDIRANVGGTTFSAELKANTANVGAGGNVSTNTYYHTLASFDRSGNVTLYHNLNTPQTSDISAQSGDITTAYEFTIGAYAFDSYKGNYMEGYIYAIGYYGQTVTEQEYREMFYLADGWKSFGGGVLKDNFSQGIVGDTIYYNTSLATGAWTISISDSAASAITYNILTSTDKTNWTQIGTDATNTTWQTSTFSGTGQGYFAIAVPSGTAYFDNLTVTNTPSGQDKGLHLNRKLKLNSLLK